MKTELALVAFAALSGWLLACNSNGEQPRSTLTPQAVVVESISPSSARVGADVVVRGSGFTATNNDVAFSTQQIDFQGRHAAYLNGVASPDGKTLRFRLPDNENVLLSACAFSQLKTNEACPAIGMLLPAGDVEVSVINDNGTSNSVAFSVTATPSSP